MVLGLLILVPGALGLAYAPLASATNRLGLPGTALFLTCVILMAIAFFPAYERLKPSSPPTPRRDFVVIVFAALVIGLWTSYFSNPVVAVLVLALVGGALLLPDGWRERFAGRLAHRR
jgi:hypothetical protein